MEKLVEKDLVRAIGLSNFNSCQIDDVLSVARIKPTVLQVMNKTYIPFELPNSLILAVIPLINVDWLLN